MAGEAIDVRKQMWKMAGKVCIKSIMTGVLALVVYISMTAVFPLITTEVIGEQVWRTDENGESVLIEEIYYTDGEKSSDDAAKDEETDENIFTLAIRSQMPVYAEILMHIITNVCMLGMVLNVAYTDMWALGDKHNNAVQFGRLHEDVWRGAKIGLLSAVPSALCFGALVLSKCGVLGDGVMAWYPWVQAPFMSLIRIITAGATATSEMEAWCLIPIGLFVLVIPTACGVGYYLGYKEFSLSEKLIYRSAEKK